MRAALVLGLLVALAGCASTAIAEVRLSQDDLGAASGEGRASCGDQATLEVAIARLDEGSVRVRVLDGAGSVAFDEIYEAGDRGSLDHGLFGAAGSWRLDASGTFSGAMTLTLHC